MKNFSKNSLLQPTYIYHNIGLVSFGLRKKFKIWKKKFKIKKKIKKLKNF